MRFLADYWWLLVLPFAIFLWIRSIRATSPVQRAWTLGALALVAAHRLATKRPPV